MGWGKLFGIERGMDAPASVASANASQTACSIGSDATLDHHLFDIGNGLCRVQTFRTGLCAIHDGVTAIELEWIFQIIEPLAGRFIPTVDDPAIGMQQRRRPEVTVAVPPIGGARR